jgi:type IV fimbrial biogenesis protein FimT
VIWKCNDKLHKFDMHNGLLTRVHNRKTMQQSQRGVTFIELIITIAILGITAAMAVPIFTEARTRAEVRSVAGEIVGAMRWARSEAMRTNQTAVIRIGPGAVCADGTAASIATTVGAAIVRCVPAAEFNVKFRSVAALSAGAVTFNSRGMTPTAFAGYSVSNTNASAKRTINVELSGRVNEIG